MDIEIEQIGTVEVLRTRIYALDPETAEHPLATQVVVQPGTYPLYRQFEAVWWMMTGKINGGGISKIGDGMFSMIRGDFGSGPDVTFPSRRYGPEQWAEFIAEPICTDGDPGQRLRIRAVENIT